MAWGLAATLVLLVAAVLIATLAIDPNRYRGKVQHVVSDLAGRPFVIAGDLRLTWYPWLGVSIGAARLGDVPGQPNLALVEWESLSAAAKLLPLLKGQLVVDRIRLQHPHVRLRRDAAGHGNWEGLGPGKKPAPATGKTRTNISPPPELAGIEIRDGVLEYVDEASGLSVNATGWDFDMGAWQSGSPLPVHTRLLVHATSLPAAGVWIEVNAPDLDVNVDPLSVNAGKLVVRVADAQIDGTVTYRPTTGALAGDHIQADGTLALTVPSVRKLAGQLGLDNSLPRDPATLGALQLASSWRYVDGAVASRPLTFRLDGTAFAGWVERSAPPAAMWSFELHGDQIDLRRYTDIETKVDKPFDLVQILKALRANGTVTFDQARLADAEAQGVSLRFETKP